MNNIYCLKIRFCRDWFSLMPGKDRLFGYFHWFGFQVWWEVEK
jgi:hypothetical protein